MFSRAASFFPSIISLIKYGSAVNGLASPTTSHECSFNACSIACLVLNPPVTANLAFLSAGRICSANSTKKASRFFVDSFLCSNARDSYEPPESSIRSRPIWSSQMHACFDSSNVRPPSAKSAELILQERAGQLIVGRKRRGDERPT